MRGRYPNNLDIDENSRFALVGTITNGLGGEKFVILFAGGEVCDIPKDEAFRQEMIEALKLIGFEVQEMDGQMLTLVIDMATGNYDADIPIVKLPSRFMQ